MVGLPDRYPPGQGGAWAYVDPDPPYQPGEGNLWFDTGDMILKVYVNDQWVPCMPDGGAGLTPGWVLAGTPPDPAITL